MLKTIYSFILKKARSSMKIFQIEERLKNIETRQKRFEKLLAGSMGKIPPLLSPEHMNVALRAFAAIVKEEEALSDNDSNSSSVMPTISLIDYTPNQWTKLLIDENIPAQEVIVPDKRHKVLKAHNDSKSDAVPSPEFMDMDMIPFAMEKVDFLFIPSPYLVDYALEFPAWLMRVSQKVNRGIVFAVQFSNEDGLTNDEVKTEGDSQIRSILHKSGFVDVLLLNPSTADRRYHSKYSSEEDFYWSNQAEAGNGQKRELGKILVESLQSIPSMYLASRLPLKD